MEANQYAELFAAATEDLNTEETGDINNLSGQNTGYGAFFSNANFIDSDAGAGKDITKTYLNSSDYIPVGNIISNLKEASMNIIHNESDMLDDKIKKMRNLSKLFTRTSVFSKLIPFLKPLDQQKDIIRMRSVLKKLERDDFNPSSQDIFKDLSIDISGSEIHNLGINIEEFADTFDKIVTEYNKSVEALLTCEKNLHNGLDMFDTIALKLDDFLNLDTNSASLDMFDAFLKYLAAFFDENSIYQEFTNFLLAYKRFIALHSLLKLTTQIVPEDERLPPLCSVCISDPVSHAFVPCGHTFCAKCVQKQMTICFVCRARYTSKMKLYFA
jgi:hypothetical protein